MKRLPPSTLGAKGRLGYISRGLCTGTTKVLAGVSAGMRAGTIPTQSPILCIVHLIMAGVCAEMCAGTIPTPSPILCIIHRIEAWRRETQTRICLPILRSLQCYEHSDANVCILVLNICSAASRAKSDEALDPSFGKVLKRDPEHCFGDESGIRCIRMCSRTEGPSLRLPIRVSRFREMTSKAQLASVEALSDHREMHTSYPDQQEHGHMLTKTGSSLKSSIRGLV